MGKSKNGHCQSVRVDFYDIILYEEVLNMKYEYAIDRKDIMDEWDWVLNNKNGIFPNEISYGSSKKIYLICPKKHKYTIRASHRFNNHRCPYCANQKVLVGFNDLESIFPDLTKEWDYERNMQKPSDVLYGSSRVVWWKCSHIGRAHV